MTLHIGYPYITGIVPQSKNQTSLFDRVCETSTRSLGYFKRDLRSTQQGFLSPTFPNSWIHSHAFPGKIPFQRYPQEKGILNHGSQRRYHCVWSELAHQCEHVCSTGNSQRVAWYQLRAKHFLKEVRALSYFILICRNWTTKVLRNAQSSRGRNTLLKARHGLPQNPCFRVSLKRSWVSPWDARIQKSRASGIADCVQL